MSRQIKFRIWDKKHRRWFHGSTDPKEIALQTDAINLFGEVIIFGEILHDQHEDDVWKKDPDIKSSLDVIEYLEVCQYTGLKDKNGKEIYEGDILGGIFEGCYVGWCDTTKSFELFNCYEHYCMACDGDILWCELSDSNVALEVIGNIHENPELLKEAS